MPSRNFRLVPSPREYLGCPCGWVGVWVGGFNSTFEACLADIVHGVWYESFTVLIPLGNGCNFLRAEASFCVTYSMSHPSSLLCGDIVIITRQAGFEELIETFPFWGCKRN